MPISRKIRAAFDGDALIDICERDDFTQYAQRVDLLHKCYGQEQFYYYKNNNSKILAVAHLDTVQQDRSCRIKDTPRGLHVYSGGLDDRLGAYVILDLLPKLGITCDWLLTTDEESGQSSARWFNPLKQYNWMFEFDRAGTDVVLYRYDSFQLRGLVGAAGATVGRGSYSDIADLYQLGCVGVNWGIGYQQYHTIASHAFIDDTLKMVGLFKKFYDRNHDTFLPYTLHQ